MTLRLLFADGEAHIPWDGSATAGPVVDLASCLSRLRAAQSILRQFRVDDLIGFFDHVAHEWTARSHPVSSLIARLGIGFLPLWMRRENLVQLTDLTCHGHRSALDRFVPLPGGDKRLFRAQPRGLVVHWVAGNVAVLGMISLLQALLAKNANLVKSPSDFAGLLPFLLSHLAKTSWTNPTGRVVEGRLVADAVMVIYAERDDLATARALSTAADVRVAWGGREAVEAIMNLPRRFGTEDIVFGPKLSFAVIGREYLADADTAKRVAGLLARDCAANDQQGCNSPHTVFVETGGHVTPQHFADLLGQAMNTMSKHTPLTQVAPAAAMKVLTKRAEYDMRGLAFYSSGMAWTVLFGTHEEGLGDPCYLRTLYVRPIEDIFSIAKLCSVGTQTAGLALASERRLALAEVLTAHGIERCPELGFMALYDTPWDGMFPISRLLRWVSAAP